MRQVLIASVIFVLFLPTLAHGQSWNGLDRAARPLPTATERKIADLVSWGTVGAALALDARASWQAQDRTHALEMQGARMFVTWGFASIAKTVTERARPCVDLPEGCGQDRSLGSFYSLHAAFACSTLGGPNFRVAVPLSFGTAGLRVMAGKHWASDVMAGCLAGALASRIR